MTEPLYCVNHPNRETYLRCNKCGRPICPQCAVQTPVGYRCRDCINAQQQVFYADFRPVYYLIAAAIAFPLSIILGGILILLASWYSVILGPIVGIFIAEAVRWAIKRRRGKHTWLVVCGCILFGGLLDLAGIALSGLYVGSLIWVVVWAVVYLVGALGAAYTFLRPGRRF